MTTRFDNYALGEWVAGTGNFAILTNAVTGEVIGEASSQGLDFAAMAEYARRVGGPTLRRMTFHERARLLKALAVALTARKEEFYRVSSWTGATASDHWIDIDGGIGTLFAYASRGRRDFPNEPFFVDGPVEALSKGGAFVGRHVCVPLEGVAVHINAFNFPVWGMLEKLSCALLAGVPAIVKPATVTCYLTQVVFRAMIDTGLLPAGSVQLICGSTGDLLDHLREQDTVAFTGSAATGLMLRRTPAIMEHNVRFNQEADSLNYSMLGPDAAPGTPEFDLFVREVAREMTVKAGQKCTAIRRSFVPASIVDDVVRALGTRLAGTRVGDPAVDGVRMGPLAGRSQVREVGKALAALAGGAEVVYGGRPDADFEVVGASCQAGAFFPITLLYNDRPFDRTAAHDVEAFGPVNTVMPYDSVDEAVALAKRGRGSLVGSLFTADDGVARDVALGTAAYHGRLLLANRHSGRESTGHGSPLPQLVHGGPGRAGGGEEMGGVRGVLHYMQRTAIQGSPTTVAAVTREWTRGADAHADRIHPFRKHFEELRVGDLWMTHRRTVTEADVVNFAGLSGDYFYAHTDEVSARDSYFGRRVAHGYLVISMAAGLFVDPAPGPVMANYGLDGLRFVKPVYIGDTIRVRLACKSKAARDDREGEIPQGVVAWDVEVTNQDDEAVAVYTVLTLVRRLYPLGGTLDGGRDGATARGMADQAPDALRPADVVVREQRGDAEARMN